MDIDKIRDLIEQLTGLMEAKKLEELEVEIDDFKIALRRSSRSNGPPAVLIASPHAGTPSAAPAVSGAQGEAAAAEVEADESEHVIHSPMVGTFYRAQEPDGDPCVEVGDEVTPDTVLCIIEAMKVMNELKAETEGTIVAIRAENGEAVEFGQPLFVIAPTKS
jgi:acetyl-CoA carboxylase biotin carboxyl carrier protein